MPAVILKDFVSDSNIVMSKGIFIMRKVPMHEEYVIIINKHN
jgi:hypothetical protein